MKIPSLVKKYLMALTGLALVGFVVGHMLGNLQFYLEPYYINAYALKLKERLQALGYRPQLAPKGNLTRVFIGPYIDKAIAQRNLDRIAKQPDLAPKLVRFIPPNE